MDFERRWHAAVYSGDAAGVLLADRRRGLSDTYLHLAAKTGKREIAETMIQLRPQLVHQTNSDGDTALHCAARFGHADFVRMLLLRSDSTHGPSSSGQLADDIESAGEEIKLVRKVNKKKETALHDAVRNGHFEVVKLLMEEDPTLLDVTNEAKESPLFVAVDRVHLEIALYILHRHSNSSVQGRNNMNALHAAVIRSFSIIEEQLSNVAFIVAFAITVSPRPFPRSIFVGWMLVPVKWMFPRLCSVLRHYSTSMVLQVIVALGERGSEVVFAEDDGGWTPLHHAAVGSSCLVVQKLLAADRSNSIAYIKDRSDGRNPLHIAARAGNVAALKGLVEDRPDIWDFLDNNGQTALHVAVGENERVKPIKFILKHMPNHLINHQDNQGNTCLHLAAIKNKHQIIKFLATDSRIDMKAENYKGLAAMDIINAKGFQLTDKHKLCSTIYCVNGGGLPRLENVSKLMKGEQATHDHNNVNETVPQQTTNEVGIGMERIRRYSETNMIVAALIATVTFAAAFTMPGGYISSGSPNQGMATLGYSKRFYLTLFIISDAIAFSSSMASIIIHYYTAWTTDYYETLSLCSRSAALSTFAMVAMGVAFVLGLYAVLPQFAGLAVIFVAFAWAYGSICLF